MITRSVKKELGYIGMSIQVERSTRNVTQDQLAKMVGMDRTYLARIEAGRANPSIKILYLISRALQLPITRLLLPYERKNRSKHANVSQKDGASTV